MEGETIFPNLSSVIRLKKKSLPSKGEAFTPFLSYPVGHFLAGLQEQIFTCKPAYYLISSRGAKIFHVGARTPLQTLYQIATYEPSLTKYSVYEPEKKVLLAFLQKLVKRCTKFRICVT